MDFKEFIKPELLILIPVLYGIGWFICVTPNIKNWLIPFILWAISIFLTTAYLLGIEFMQAGNNVAAFIFADLTQATLCAAAAVFAANVIKQLTTGKAEDDAGG